MPPTTTTTTTTTTTRALLALPVAALTLALSAGACDDDSTNCNNNNSCATGAGGGGAQGGGGDGGAGGSGGNLGGGGNNPGGGGTGGVPDCVEDVDCTNPQNAHCDNGSCVPCTNSNHCVGVTGLPVCDTDNNICVQCLLDEEDACTANNSCDLLAKECVPVAPASLQTCDACTNDNQCQVGFRCVPMEFPETVPHGYFCLEENTGSCSTNPYRTPVTRMSISGTNAEYCGIPEAIATCEAVHALRDDWQCTIDGMCSPDGIEAEKAVPGAICRTVNSTANRCTYQCGTAPQCPVGYNCIGGPPTFCGG